MKLIKPQYEILHQEPGLDGVYLMIEKAGRLCYASDPIEGKAKTFVDRMIDLGHGAMLEHGTVYLSFYVNHGVRCDIWENYKNNKYSKTTKTNCGKTGLTIYVTTNLRVLVENNWLEDLQYICEPTEHHEKRVTVYINHSRVQGESLLRHRVFSFAKQSTRYCNYSKTQKFGNHISYIMPHWLNVPEGIYSEKIWKYPLWGEFDCDKDKAVEADYIAMLMRNNDDYMLMSEDLKPEDARAVLNFSVASPMIMTGFVSDWKHVFNLRVHNTTGKAHPEIQDFMSQICQEFETQNLL